MPYSFMLLIRSTDARLSGNVVLLGSLLDKVLCFLDEQRRQDRCEGFREARTRQDTNGMAIADLRELNRIFRKH